MAILKSLAGLLYSNGKVVSVVGETAENGGIESGSNGNGSYTKFPDGTLICSYVRDFTDVGIDIANGSTFIRGSYAWTFPVEFISTPIVTGSIRRTATVNTFVSMNAINNTSCSYFLGASIALPATLTKEVYVTAIGRWK